MKSKKKKPRICTFTLDPHKIYGFQLIGDMGLLLHNKVDFVTGLLALQGHGVIEIWNQSVALGLVYINAEPST